MRLAAVLAAALALLLAAPGPTAAHHRQRWSVGDRVVEVAVEVGHRSAPLYPSPDGSGRYYVEARRGLPYAIRLRNRVGRRLGVELRIDGLDAISGEPSRGHRRGRLYVLEPWGSAEIRGWRSSLDGVHRFEFVDERSSYAARSGRATSRLGWIEVRAFRELARRRPVPAPQPITPGYDEGRRSQPERQTEPSAGQSPSRPEDHPASDAVAEEPGTKRSYPGTGWGRRLADRARVVDFEAEPRPAETLTLRYEYASALYALGVWPLSGANDRLGERERGVAGFAQPPPRR